MQQDNIKKLFITKYAAIGEEKFYKFLISYALGKIVESSDQNKFNPALELIDYYEMFLKLYRREGEEIHLELAKQFRRAGHRVYRIMRNKNMMDKSSKFLNLV